MGRSQRTKGHSFERAIATAMRAVFPGARRGLGQARAANEVADVDGTGWWVECKAHRHVQIRAAFRQAIEAAQGRAPVLVVSKDDREPVLATLLLDDLLKIFAVRASLPAAAPSSSFEVKKEELNTTTRPNLAAASSSSVNYDELMRLVWGRASGDLSLGYDGGQIVLRLAAFGGAPQEIRGGSLVDALREALSVLSK